MIMDFKHIAQEMIDAVAPVVSARTINIMDTDAIIIASSDPKRIGTFHQGAFEVITGGKTVYINKEDVDRYPGAREGINLPIVLGEKTVGVVGIYGDPENVKDAANLLCAYVKKYLENTAIESTMHLQDDVRTRILRMLLFSKSTNYREIEQLAHVLGINIEMPVRVFAFAISNLSANTIETAKSLDRILQVLLKQKFLVRESDIYGIIDDIFFCVKKPDDIHSFKKYIKNLYEVITEDFKFNISLVCGEICADTSEIRRAASQIKTMLYGGPGCLCMDDNETRIDYLLRMLYETGNIKFTEDMYEKLETYFGRSKMRKVMFTVETYCKHDGSIAAASDELQIHKNTLLYRMKAICSALGLEDENSFTKEIFFRLLVTYHHQTKLHN